MGKDLGEGAEGYLRLRRRICAARQLPAGHGQFRTAFDRQRGLVLLCGFRIRSSPLLQLLSCLHSILRFLRFIEFMSDPTRGTTFQMQFLPICSDMN